MYSTKRKTTDEFAKRAKEIHGNKYDYSKVEYVNNITKVCIICPIHGEFLQTPKSHLNGCGCYECAREKWGKTNKLRKKIGENTIRTKKISKRKINNDNKEKYAIKTPVDTNTFIEEARKIHGDKYGYSKVEYTNSHTKICIICPKHGEFYQTPSQHLKGHGCDKCARENNGRQQRVTKEEFIEFANQKWNNKYDYSQCEYIDYYTKVKIICPKHGEFWQTPIQHLKACGCLKCVSEYKHNLLSSNTEEFIKKSEKIFHDKYSYEHVKYINNSKKVMITCPKHGDFLCTPANHLKGRGCPICKTEHYVYEERLYNLLLEIFDKNDIQRQTKTKWLTNNKSLDFYLPKYNLAIEHQGSQHFIPQVYFGGQEKFSKGVLNDMKKYEECWNNNIKLLYFAYEKNTVPKYYIDKVFTDENKFRELLKEIKINNKIIKKR